MAIDLIKARAHVATKKLAGELDEDTKSDAVGASHALDTLRAVFYGTEFEEAFNDVIGLVDLINDA